MEDDKIVSKIKEFALKNSELDDTHGFKHVERVYDLSLLIGKKLNANLTVLKIAALLHDIGRIDEEKDNKNRNHAEISAQKALDYLNSNDFKISQKDIDNVIHSIKAHSFSNKIVPKTLEAKILSDADKLDAIGAIGLYRTISFTTINKGGIIEVIDHLERKISKLKDEMYLEISKDLAKDRQKIVVDFYNEIKKEMYPFI